MKNGTRNRRRTPMQQPFWTTFRRTVAVATALYLVCWLALRSAGVLRGETQFFLLVPILLGLISFFVSIAAGRTTASQLRSFLRLPWLYKAFEETYAAYRFLDLCRSLER